jgi:hypothetical protein
MSRAQKNANLISIAVFLLSLAAFLIILLPHSQKSPSTTTSTVSTVQVVQGADDGIRRTQTTQKTTNDVVPPIWLNLLGGRQTAFLIIAISTLAAYFIAAIVQGVLLGKYGLTAGPFSVREITSEQFEYVIRPALPDAVEGIQEAVNSESIAGFDNGSFSSSAAGEIVPEEKPTWTTIGDPNLALAGWRIDLERELKRLSERFGIPASDQRTPRKMISALAERDAITNTVANSLQDLLAIANRGVHGAKVDSGVLVILRTDGLELLTYLQSRARPTSLSCISGSPSTPAGPR